MSENPFTVLIVDDNPVNRELWSLYLASEGHEVETAADGEEALRLLDEAPVDLVLLDVMLPGLDGFEVLEKLRRERTPEELPVVMATAKDKSEDIVRGFELGANDYVTKPIHLDVLLARVTSQLRSRVPARESVSPDLRSVSVVPAGTVLEGKFEVEGLIGQGSCGAVYRATHLGLRRPVALKLLTSAAGVASAERLKREGISVCRLEHPNAVEVLDLCVTDGIPFLVMELLEGHSLDEELDREGTLTPRRCAEILLPTCEVLAEAHRQGIIHRDVKPQNIYLHQGRRGEVVKVLDFGIARMLGESVLHQRLTIEGSLVGTPAYMAPERLADAPYDGGADVYSLGVMLYEMLAGRRPFSSVDLLELIRMHLHQPPQPLGELCPDLPRGIDAAVLRALTKDPVSRPSAEELARSFRAALDESAGSGQPVATEPRQAGSSQAGPRQAGPRQAGSRRAGGDRAAAAPWAVATLLEPVEE